MWKRIGFLLALLLLIVTGASAQYSSTTNLALKKPNSGLTAGWDTYINGDFDSLDAFLAGVGTLTSNSATPSVSAGTPTWIASNSSTTAITNFTGGYSGQRIRIVCQDSNTTMATGTNLQLVNAFTCNSGLQNSITLVLNGTVWTEVSRTFSTIRTIGYAFGDANASGAVALTTSEVGYVTVPFACTIVGWHFNLDAADTVTIKTYRVNGGTAHATSGNSISTSGVSISTGTAVDSITVTDFTSTALAANDHLTFAITAIGGTAKQITFQLDCAQ